MNALQTPRSPVRFAGGEARPGVNCAGDETWEMPRVQPWGGAEGGGHLPSAVGDSRPGPFPTEGAVRSLALQRRTCGKG